MPKRRPGSEDSSRVERQPRALLKKLDEQCDFLRKNIAEYERGARHFAYQAAANVRALVSPRETPPLFTTLAERFGVLPKFVGQPGGRFDQEKSDALTFYMSSPQSPGGVSSDSPFKKLLSFESWWGELVLLMRMKGRQLQYLRSEVVLGAAHYEGVHVKSLVPEKFAALVDDTALRIVVPGSSTINIVQSVVIESGRELLRVIAESRARIDSTLAFQELGVQPPRSRNAVCPCGSGKRFKNCHGRLS